MAGIDRLAGSGASLEQLGELEGIRPRVAPPEFESPVGVILAAGTGSRLGVGSKALARLAGITLLERAVATLRAVGIEEILVVAGYEKARLREFVRERGLGVRLVENGDFRLGNGSSAFAGARAAGGRFLLAMVDHVVDPEALRRLLRSEAAFALAVDSRPHACDLDEATKVRLQGQRVVAVGVSWVCGRRSMPGSPSATPRSPTSRSAALRRGSRAGTPSSAAGWEKAAR